MLRGLDGKQVCPFCGSVSEKSGAPCQRCGMDNTPDARKATKARIGPWYVLQARNPAAPGMRFETLLSFVRKGRVRARSVVRGPTTHQLWRFAAHVKGLSREFGLCFSCGSSIDPAANICPQCNRLQEPPINPDVLLEEHGAGEDGGAGARPVYRELPGPDAAGANGAAAAADAAPAAAATGAAPAPPPPEEVDIVIPALGGFGPDDLDTKFSDSPVKGATPAASAGIDAARVRAVRAAAQRRRPAPAPAPAGSAHAAPAAGARRQPLRDRAAARGGRRKKGNGDGSFLSAKELAAAFKLSFDPGADMDTVDVPDQMPAGALPDGMRPSGLAPRMPAGLAAAAAAPAGYRAAAAARRARGAFRKFVLFCLILAATGFGVLMWVDPAFRAKTVEWSKATAARLQAYANGADKRPAAGPARRRHAARGAGRVRHAGARRPGRADDRARHRPRTAVPASTRPLPRSTRADPEPDAQPAAARPTVATETPPVVTPPPTPRETKRSPAPAPKASANTAKQQPPAPASTGSQGASDDADEIAKAKTWQQLYRVAGRAEQRRDYVTALRAFEKVKALPADQQPTSIDLNLSRVRRELKK